MHILFLVVCLRFSWGGGVIFKNMLAGVSKKKKYNSTRFSMYAIERFEQGRKFPQIDTDSLMYNATPRG